MLFDRNARPLLQPLHNATCIQVDAKGDVSCAVGGTTLDELTAVLGVKRPTATEKDLDTRTAEVRRAIQRRFTADRMKNCMDFKAYILGMAQGREGVLPPITFYSKDYLALNDKDEVCRTSGSPIIAIDGETQLEAIFSAADEDPAISSGLQLTFIIHAGKEPEIAQLYTHDLNAKGRSIKEAEVASLNIQSPIVNAIKAGVEASEIEGGMSAINRSGDGMGSKFKPFATTYKRLLNLALGVHHGLEHCNVSLDAFLSTYTHPESLSHGAAVAIADAVTEYLRLPREQRVKLGQTESRALGMVAHAHTDAPLTERCAAKILHNRAGLSGKGPTKEKFRAITAGLI